MILDTIARLPLYESQIPGAKEIASAFLSQVPQSAPCEVREKSYALKEDDKRRFEVHFRTIDLMIAAEGAEVIHICPADQLVPAEFLPNGADGRKMDGSPKGTAALLEQGWFCAIFPGEAHMVGGKTQDKTASVSKWVVKVPCPDEFAVNP
ncbi:MAG: YhcH/YjgK/YiaL family protein [Clostridia bacterium]|nr:YhcH/YjgK/YiaL family protein [Clostridia bacterium]